MTRQQAEPGGDSDAAARVLKRIQGHVALGELRSAGKLLQEHALAGPALDELTAWRSSLSQLEGDSRAGVLGAADHAQARRKLASELLRLARAALEPDAERSGRPPHLAAGSSGADLAAAPGTGSEHRPVFLSYSHADSAVAQALRSALEQAGIGVRIDVAAMRPGESIEAFVRTSIRDTRATVCLVSKASLMSGWVGLETLRALADQALWEQRRFVACALDDAYLSPDVRLELTRRIDQRLAEIARLQAAYAEQRLDSVDLDAERTRLHELRHGLGPILGHLRATLGIELTPAHFEHGVQQLVQALRNP